MKDKIEGVLEVGHNENGEVVINHPDLKPDENGVGHIVFSPRQARHLAALLNTRADQAENEMLEREAQERRKAAGAIPVDRGARTLTDGSPVTEDHRDIISGGPRDGQQKGYVVLSESERQKGFVRPYRESYVHKSCGAITTMGRSIAETYARDPKFYGGTFCATCRQHYPLDQFVWTGTDERVGS